MCSAPLFLFLTPTLLSLRPRCRITCTTTIAAIRFPGQKRMVNQCSSGLSSILPHMCTCVSYGVFTPSFHFSCMWGRPPWCNHQELTLWTPSSNNNASAGKISGAFKGRLSGHMMAGRSYEEGISRTCVFPLGYLYSPRMQLCQSCRISSASSCLLVLVSGSIWMRS